MIETLDWSLRMVREQTLREMTDIPFETFHLQEYPGEAHPAWILGHLLLADIYLLHLLDGRALSPDFSDLLCAHGPGSTPGQDSAVYLPAPDFIQRLQDTGRQRSMAISTMAPDGLQRPMPDANLAATQPTLGHHLHAQVFHEGHHQGQLAAWRRLHGFGPGHWFATQA